MTSDYLCVRIFPAASARFYGVNSTCGPRLNLKIRIDSKMQIVRNYWYASFRELSNITVQLSLVHLNLRNSEAN